MLFNSYRFLFVFLPVVLAIYWLTPSLTWRKYISVGASYVFYGVWSAKFALLMLGTTSVDFFTARLINDTDDPRRRKLWMIVSMLSNLGVLGIFKYYDFFASSVNSVSPGLLPLLHVALPIGISFYTFESMSYTIDVYRGKIPAVRHFMDYAHFVTMFPRLVAGPIARYTDMAAQFRALPRWLPAAETAEAIHFFTIGLVKKLLIADYLAARLVNPLFATPGNGLKFFPGWGAALAYTAQLYFDFSGYSDMAVGLALLLGFRLPRNFNLPYVSRDIAEFWRRWHISLSTWLRDYLYIPLGGNRKGAARTQLNLFLTMLLGGLWHGANWTFVIWGAYHGLALLIHRGLSARLKPLPRWLALPGTLVIVVVGWVMFRANTLTDALHVYRAMLGLNGFGLAWVRANLAPLAILAGALLLSITVDTYEARPAMRMRWAVAYGLLMVACLTQFAAPSPFLYFQF